MKLIHRITIRISISLLVLLTLWAVVFYFIIIDEINDETDDSLEDYAEQIITRALAGEALPSADNGTNNSYYITPISPEYAKQHEGIRYSDEMIYIVSKKETEPARILKTIFRDKENNYRELTVSIPTIEKEDLRETILSWIISLYVVLLLTVIGINLWIVYRSFKPLYSLLGWLDRYSIDSEIPPLESHSSVTEFRKLNEAILRSARRNAEMYEQQKQFIGNTSHELQTPLAICRNRLEMLIDESGLSGQQLEELLKTRQTLDHIIKLNKTLLLLAKIENRQFPEQKEIDVNSLIKRMLEDFEEVYSYRNVSVSIHEENTFRATMHETLASVLFSNLIKNAFAHNLEEGKISIHIRTTEIVFCNTGCSLPLDDKQIFKRFYQGSKSELSSGLGLALSESICKLYDMQLRYSFTGNEHCFSISLS